MAGPLASPDAWRLVASGYTQHLTPLFAHYALHALHLAGVDAASVVLDVAAGPGTLALLAAPRVAQVDALDFAPEMVAALQARIAADGLSNVTAVQGDGQDLPFAADTYDAAFSMFGLMFFPDRARGLRELCRVVRPGGCVVISSWPPLEGSPALATFFRVMGEVLPPPPGTDSIPAPMPLSSPALLQAELAAAGLQDITVQTVVQEARFASAEAFWALNDASSAPLALLRRTLGPAAYADFAAGMRRGLREHLSDAPFSSPWPALVGMGRVPA